MMMSRFSIVRNGLAGLTLVALIALSSANVNGGQCSVPVEEGMWVNWDVNTRGITRVDFDMECHDATTTECNGNICRTTFGVKSKYFLRTFGSCHPTDCDWGRIEGVKYGDWYVFTYRRSYKTTYVWVRTYSQWPGWLRVYQYTDFTAADGRTDYSSDDWFFKM